MNTAGLLYALLALVVLAQGRLSRPLTYEKGTGGQLWTKAGHNEWNPLKLASLQNQESFVNISVNLTDSPFQVSTQFLSVTFDASALDHYWKYTIDFSLPAVVTLAKGLAPAMARVGGISQDFILFKLDEPFLEEESQPKLQDHQLPPDLAAGRMNYTMNTSQWDAVNLFTQEVGWDFVFGLNLLLRHPWPNGSWDTANAELLMNYCVSKGYKVNWELGNEPDEFPTLVPNIPVTPEQDAKDFAALRALVYEKSPTAQYVAGPDTAFINNGYFEKFLTSVEEGDINAASWHTYYKEGDKAVLPDFFNATLLDKTVVEATTAHDLVRMHRPDVELWLGETSSCSGGGAPVLSSAYVAGFMWLDKLGIAAVTNHSRVFRQSFAGQLYSLLDKSFNPRPDYWLSLLHKRLVGTRVLMVDNGLQLGRHVRVYAHCAKAPYVPGSVVLLIVHVNTYDTNITLGNNELSFSDRDVYWLTPPGGTANITSFEVTLNGQLLQMDGASLPSLTPKQESASDTVFLPALSFGFYVFKSAGAAACK